MTWADVERDEADAADDDSLPPQDVKFSLQTLLFLITAFCVIASVAKFLSALLALLLVVILAQYGCFRLLRRLLRAKRVE